MTDQIDDKSSKTNYPALDGLRAIAIILVMATHASAAHVPGGWIGVDIFFVLSGYLITGVLLRPQTTLSAFYLRRARRLFPALLCTIALTYFLWPYTGPEGPFWIAALKALFYVSDISQAHGRMLGCLSHTWSLSVEEQFYALWPVLLFKIPGLRRSWKAIGALILLSMAVRILLLRVYPPLVSYFSPLTRADELLCGAVLAVGGTQIGSAAARIAPLAVVGDLLFCLGHVGNWKTTATFVIPALGLGTVAIISKCIAAEGSALKRFLSVRPLVWMGKRSYGIYLYHMPIFYFLATVGGTHGHFMQLVLAPVASTLLAHLSYRFVEQPILHWKPESMRKAHAESPGPG
jgi:peptidoglycan/LPS O-acetylase OafA/YrhL